MAVGELLLIGGAEDKEEECTILKWFVNRSREIDGPIVIITTGTKSPDVVGLEYSKVLKKLGCNELEVFNIQSRLAAQNQSSAEKLKHAAGIFFTGGDQLRITSILGGTPISKALIEAYQDGAIIAGTSAGAAIMSDTMIVEGEDDESPRRCTVKMAPGLGLIKKIVVDMHFSQRGRQGRLLAAIGQNPHIIGIGIDEDSAIVINKDRKLEVIGSRTVWIVDGRDITYSNVSELAPDEVLVLSDVCLHVLPERYGYDLNHRMVLKNENTRVREE